MRKRPGDTPVRGISWDRIYPRCVWCDGENYALAVIAYSRREIPCAAVGGCGRYLPKGYGKVIVDDEADEPESP